MRYPHFARLLQSQLWAIDPSKLDEILLSFDLLNAGQSFSVEEIAARTGGAAGTKPGPTMAGAIAVIPVFGTIMQRASLMSQISGGTSTEEVGGFLSQAMNDPAVGSILLDISSPGGGVFGVPELAAQIMQARATKPIVGIANSMAASAAYWIGAACSQLVMSPSAQVGSIGVFTGHRDMSGADENKGITTTIVSAGKYKTEGNPYGPLSDEAKAEMQSQCDAYYLSFRKAVAAGRGASLQAVTDDFGQGRLVRAPDALKAGMVDRVATFGDTVARMARSGGASPRQAAALGDAAEIEATAAEEIEAALETPVALIPDVPEAGGMSPADEIDLRRRRMSLFA